MRSTFLKIKGIVTTSRELLLHQGDYYYIKGIVTRSRGLLLHQGDCYYKCSLYFLGLAKLIFTCYDIEEDFNICYRYHHMFVFRLFESMAFRHGIRALYRASENPSDKLHRFNIKFFIRISSNILSKLNFFLQECKQCV